MVLRWPESSRRLAGSSLRAELHECESTQVHTHSHVNHGIKAFVLFLFEIYSRPQGLQIAQGFITNHLRGLLSLLELSTVFIRGWETTSRYVETQMYSWLRGDKDRDGNDRCPMGSWKGPLNRPFTTPTSEGSSAHYLWSVGFSEVPESYKKKCYHGVSNDYPEPGCRSEDIR